MVDRETRTPPEILTLRFATALWLMAWLSSCSPLDANPVRRVGTGNGEITAYDVARSERGPVIARAVRQGERVALLYTDWTGNSPQGEPAREVLEVDRGDFQSRLGNDLRIASSGKRRLIVWQTRGAGFRGRGPLQMAISDDAGWSWQPVEDPPGQTRGDQGYLDLEVDPAGLFHLVWLEDTGSLGKSLLHAWSRNGRRWSPPEIVDAVTCECCSNRLSIDASGALFLLYRDLAPRDMRVAHKRPGQDWVLQARAGEFDWETDSCPHQGGGLAVAGGPSSEEASLHAAVWTGAQDHVGSYYLSSEDDGASWSAILPVGSETANQIDLVTDGIDAMALAWLEVGTEGPQISFATSDDRGRTWQPTRDLDSGDAASRPRVVALEAGGFEVFWTEQRETQRVLVAQRP